ncbi:Asp23/Gls24 family envelope stress response protein [Thermosyntropha sp.]|uniref:Asp23/Gls24 family envelope stress response protein n=1 Tax=Thermosyntropha sp. TaxID=2740820 RepID=UPI0025CD0E7B|nr:Asp23/Gls24 family envelope stress response protein [Thermosyntropha sp.]MBO8159456.1 Asp23/Gls24 family envelope stress response protein [Thermosyntropha sp.]
MYKVKNTGLGDIFVGKEVVETIAGLAAIDCYGLVGMVPQNIQSGLTSILGMESVRKGVEVRDSDEGLIVDLYVIVGYGVKIHEVAHNVMQKVTYVLENDAGLPVARVNVNIKGVKVMREN